MKSILLTLLFSFLLGAQVTKPGLTTVAPELIAGLDLHPALVYARYGQREMALDLYRPNKTATPLPAIVCIHGGGWFKGERSNMTPLAQTLAFMSGDGDHESTHAKEPRRDLKALGIATNLTLIPQAPHAFLGGQRAFDVCVTACGEAVNPAPTEPTE